MYQTNQLEGSLPSIPAFQKAPIEALRNNKGLCGNVSGLVSCPTPSTKSHNHKTNKVLLVLFPTLGILILALLAFGVSCCLHQRVSTEENQVVESQTQDLFAIWSYDGKMV